MVVEPKIMQMKSKKFFLKMLVYGDNGVGKTVFAASAEDCDACKEVLFVNVEGGTLSISDRKDLDVWDVMKFNDIKEVLTYLQEAEHKYRTVIIDSVTELQLRGLDMVVAEAWAAPARGKPRTNEDEIRLEDYGTNTKQIRKIIGGFRDLPMHVILTAIAIESKDEEGVVTVGPQLTDKARNSVMGYMDIVAYMHAKRIVKENEETIIRSLIFQPYGKFKAKDRSNKMGDFLIEPTVSKIIDLARGKIKPSKFSIPTMNNKEGE